MGKKVKNKLAGPDEFYLIFTVHMIPVLCQQKKRYSTNCMISISKH